MQHNERGLAAGRLRHSPGPSCRCCGLCAEHMSDIAPQATSAQDRKPSVSPFFFASRMTACACLRDAPMTVQNSLITCADRRGRERWARVRMRALAQRMLLSLLRARWQARHYKQDASGPKRAGKVAGGPPPGTRAPPAQRASAHCRQGAGVAPTTGTTGTSNAHLRVQRDRLAAERVELLVAHRRARSPNERCEGPVGRLGARSHQQRAPGRPRGQRASCECCGRAPGEAGAGGHFSRVARAWLGGQSFWWCPGTSR